MIQHPESTQKNQTDNYTYITYINLDLYTFESIYRFLMKR